VDAEREDSGADISSCKGAESGEGAALVSIFIFDQAFSFFPFLRISLRGSLPLRRRSLDLGFLGFSEESEGCFDSSASEVWSGTSMGPDRLIFARHKYAEPARKMAVIAAARKWFSTTRTVASASLSPSDMATGERGTMSQLFMFKLRHYF